MKDRRLGIIEDRRLGIIEDGKIEDGRLGRRRWKIRKKKWWKKGDKCCNLIYNFYMFFYCNCYSNFYSIFYIISYSNSHSYHTQTSPQSSSSIQRTGTSTLSSTLIPIHIFFNLHFQSEHYLN